MNKVSYLDLAVANEQIQTTDIKGKEYAEVNQRIKAFRMVYPMGTISTEMLSNEEGTCVFRAVVSNGLNILGTGTAYEKENSSFINKTSYIENCETSAVGRALGMAGFGIDTSVASAEEVRNAINNQKLTEEEAKDLKINFGKYSGKTLNEIFIEDEKYLEWLRDNTNQEQIKQAINIIKPLPSEEEQNEKLYLIYELNKLLQEKGIDNEKINKHYGVETNSEMTIEQLKDAIKKLEEK